MSSFEEGLEEPWGQLVSIDTEQEERYPIIDKQFTIGRKPGCDIVLAGNKLVSSCHCTLILDDDRIIWCKDTSTNGTLVDRAKIKNDKVKLTDSQIIRIVFQKENSKDNIAFKFMDLRSPAIIPPPELDMTQEYADFVEIENEEVSSKKRKTLNEGEEEEVTKEESEPPYKVCKVDEKETTLELEKENENKLKEDKLNDKEDTMENKDDKNEKEEEVKRKIDEKNAENKVVLPIKPELVKKDSIEETLICLICQEILHDCVSLQPCTHTYCGGCYSEWMEYSKECPSCRLNVERVTKNFIVNNLVSAYLRANPDKQRSEDDLKDLDAKNKIAKDMTISSSSRPLHITSISTTPFHHTPVSTFTHFAPPTQCRQCPGYSGPSSSSISERTPPVYTCTSTSNHVLCMCCMLPMPDRRADTDITIPPQKCDICSKAFCHMYWGCTKLGCHGCLNLFKDVTIDDSVMNSILCNNSHESRILKNYLREKSITISDMIASCLEKLDTGTYQAPDTRTARISSTSRTCYSCAVNNLKELIYQYRNDINQEDLPSEVTSRPNCHWGRNCRTQSHNITHAENYNHICPQTRF